MESDQKTAGVLPPARPTVDPVDLSRVKCPPVHATGPTVHACMAKSNLVNGWIYDYERGFVSGLVDYVIELEHEVD